MLATTKQMIENAIRRTETLLTQAKESQNALSIESYTVQLAHLKFKLKQLGKGAYPNQ